MILLESLHQARLKSLKAQDTSEVFSNDDDKETRKKKKKYIIHLKN